MRSARCLSISMKYLLILCLVLVSLSTAIARKHGPHSGPPDLRIVGGYEASLRSHPYIVSLQMDFLFVKKHICGGSLLNERWILTAGHCVKGFWFMKWLTMEAIVGTNDLKNKESTAQTVIISKRIPHPNYDIDNIANDIAMLKTAKKIQYNSVVRPIKFAVPMGFETHKIQNLILAGWGALKNPTFLSALPNKLQEARVEYLPIDKCQKAVDAALLAATNSEEFEKITLGRVNYICTGPITGGLSGCSGDSGGPLIQYILYNNKDITTDTNKMSTEDIEYKTAASDENEESNDDTSTTEDTGKNTKTTEKVFEGSVGIVQKYKDDGLVPVLIGVVSWTIAPCGSVGSPTVYTNVSTYADFIHKHLYD